MANLHQLLERPNHDQPEITHSDDRFVDKVMEINDQNQKFMKLNGYSDTEIRNICHGAAFVAIGSVIMYTKGEDPWE